MTNDQHSVDVKSQSPLVDSRIDLADYEKRVHLDELRTRVDGQKLDYKLRLVVTVTILGLAWFLNVSLVLVVGYTLWNGHTANQSGVLTERVMLALVAATAAQVGAAFFLVTRYLFPTNMRANPGRPKAAGKKN